MNTSRLVHGSSFSLTARVSFYTAAEFCQRSKLVTAVIVAAFKINHSAGNIS